VAEADAGPAGESAPPADAGEQAAAAPETEPAERPALLSISSAPAACGVSVDEVEVPGTTPMSDVSVEPGQEHAVVVSCPDHLPQRKTVIIGPGQNAALSFAPKKAAVRQAYGYLKLDTDPWTEVYLKRRKLGITPLLKVRLPAGRHRLRLVNQEAGLKRFVPVTIHPNKTTTLFKKL